MKVTVVDDPLDESADVLVCCRVQDVPIPEVSAQIEHCSHCSERIWVSHVSPKVSTKLCRQCLQQMSLPDERLNVCVTPRQYQELREWFRRATAPGPKARD